MTITKVNCPSCGVEVVWNEDSQFRPFCSKRCQLHDFGDWAREEFRIESESDSDGELSGEEDY